MRSQPHRTGRRRREAGARRAGVVATLTRWCLRQRRRGPDAADGVASLRVASSDDQTANSTARRLTRRATSSALEAPDDPEEAFALYDQCLQDHGVDPGKGFVVSRRRRCRCRRAGGRGGHSGLRPGQPGVRVRRWSERRPAAGDRREADRRPRRRAAVISPTPRPTSISRPSNRRRWRTPSSRSSSAWRTTASRAAASASRSATVPGTRHQRESGRAGGAAAGLGRSGAVPGGRRGMPVGLRRLPRAR